MKNHRFRLRLNFVLIDEDTPLEDRISQEYNLGKSISKRIERLSIGEIKNHLPKAVAILLVSHLQNISEEEVEESMNYKSHLVSIDHSKYHIDIFGDGMEVRFEVDKSDSMEDVLEELSNIFITIFGLILTEVQEMSSKPEFELAIYKSGETTLTKIREIFGFNFDFAKQNIVNKFLLTRLNLNYKGGEGSISLRPNENEQDIVSISIDLNHKMTFDNIIEVNILNLYQTLESSFSQLEGEVYGK